MPQRSGMHRHYWLESVQGETIEQRRRGRCLLAWACLWVACYARNQPQSWDSQSFVVGVRAGAEAATSPRLAFRLYKYMAKSNKVIPKKKRGRPATGKDPITALRLSPKLTHSIESWAADQDDEPNRSEAIRRLIEIGLKVKQK